MPKPRVLGECYVCGRKCWGRRVYDGNDPGHYDRKGVIVRDVNGIRHGGCAPFPRSEASRVTPSDA